MIIKKRMKRPMTQKAMAEKFGVSVSTVKNYISFPREDYLKEAEEKRRLAFNLRSSGLKWKEVAEKMNTTEYSAVAYYRRYLALQEKQI
ncbi:helix-turn-helix transcriptional regulator [Cronobacter sakazakii]|mgnify:FL=1|uniref:helix-turn-helix domain-containing protein n=1 Tax=Cronobacter sakazakii TaxID=28141 RepID=UPI000CF1C4F6|nr:helix-turn-helix transcriptional regulator [Cronobacter sakazakii]EGT5187252.1 XRE family transcriptional regulator [Cronobacter sakazakii]EGT5768236.1 XRE family transcriptional regulator [Cronobacter sakazakii]EJG0744818.1 helix-turn-helix transcriptional regulator [Cronobacter sakazakii]EJG0748971.1 helix-turn-helix transcriptional regulator [Cronobacter sakazakii]ELY2536720.1 helix-turn-helix transcriptional regulator [Cronobacter sakazakii]